MGLLNKKTFYIFASFIAGFSLMTVELISSRIVAPIIGNSIFTWTSVIGVTLLGLSLGSWIGGIIADNTKNKNILPLAFLISSILVFFIPILAKNTDFLLKISDSILWLNLFLSIYLFLLPAISIGTIQPIVLKNFADDFSKIGSRYGLLSAVWSIGSVLGVFLTGFVFISTIGSYETVFLMSLILIITGLFFINDDKNILKLFILIMFLGMLYFYFIKTTENTSKNIVFQKETNYYNAKVVDLYIDEFGQSRALFLDVDSHSIQPEKISEHFYPEMYPVFSHLKTNIKDILVLGAGAYTMPKYFKNYYKDSSVSVIEVDKELQNIGEKYFDLKKYDINTIIGDAKIIIKKDPKKYDLIFGDAYNSFISVPWYLLTKEWNKEIKEKLNENGIYAINFIGSIEGEGSNFTNSIVNTFKIIYPNFYVFVFGINPTQIQNIVLVGINGELPIKEDILYDKLFSNKSFLYKRVFSTEYFNNKPSIILTDNFSPIEKLMQPIVTKYLPTSINFINTYWR